jgi:formylglycine-generating enzyme required for sulfatase activity
MISWGRIVLGPIVAAGLLYLSSVGRGEVVFDWASVGNPGNGMDRLYVENNPTNLRFGTVNYCFLMSPSEVTNDQYVEFLNAADSEGTNLYTLYNVSMSADARGGILFDAGAGSGSKYASKVNMGNKPVNFVSFIDAMRFVNWLEHGQPTDGSGTEDGVYKVGDPTKPGEVGEKETRALGASHFIPNENEWYKAAYYDPRSADEGGPPLDDAPMGQENRYWLYPTRSDTVPAAATADSVGDVANPGIGVANYGLGADWNGQDGHVTTVGSAGAESASYYGTFDQGGNVWEWNEAVPGVTRGLRGGSWLNSSAGLAASTRTSGFPDSESELIGFRIAGIVFGDLNHTCACDFDDIEAFVLGLSDPLLYKTTYGSLPAVTGDMDKDADFDFDDIPLFVEKLNSNGIQVVPEPYAIHSAALGLLLLVLVGRRNH